MMDINWDKKSDRHPSLEMKFWRSSKKWPKVDDDGILNSNDLWREKRKEIYFSFFLFLTSTEGELKNHSSPEYQTIHKNTSFASL